MDKQLKLGLDLKGGVHLVLRVQTDDALRLETEQDDGAAARGPHDDAASSSRTSRCPTRRSSVVEGVPPAQDARVPAGGRRRAGELRPQLRHATAPTPSR